MGHEIRTPRPRLGVKPSHRVGVTPRAPSHQAWLDSLVGKQVTAYFNGPADETWITGTLLWADQFTLMIRYDEPEHCVQLVFKSAISSIQPKAPGA